MEYDEKDSAFLFSLTDILNSVDKLENIDFIKEVINDCLKENFDACCKDE